MNPILLFRHDFLVVVIIKSTINVVVGRITKWLLRASYLLVDSVLPFSEPLEFLFVKAVPYITNVVTVPPCCKTVTGIQFTIHTERYHVYAATAIVTLLVIFFDDTLPANRLQFELELAVENEVNHLAKLAVILFGIFLRPLLLLDGVRPWFKPELNLVNKHICEHRKRVMVHRAFNHRLVVTVFPPFHILHNLVV